MASKRQQKAGFPLPNPVDGWPLLDICLKIPNAPEYRRAFLGHINKLGLWTMWEKSYLPGDTRARDAAQLWRDVLYQYLEMDCDMGCCPEPNATRINPDGSSSVSYDGGETWVPNPDDPRTTAPQLPPPSTPPGAETKCKAANNALQQIKDAQAEFAANLGTGVTIVQLALAIAGVVALVFFTAGAAAFIVPIMLELAAGIITLTAAAYNALFTTTVWDYVLCQLYCNMGEDGTFTQANFNEIMSKLDGHFSGNLALTFSGILRGWQLVGLNNAARIPSTSNLDCSACECGAKRIYVSPGGGTEISWDGTNLVAEPVFADGIYQLYVQYVPTNPNDVNNCGYLTETVVSGTMDGAYAHWLCGSGTPTTPISPPNANCANQLLFRSSVPFQLSMTAVDCP